MPLPLSLATLRDDCSAALIEFIGTTFFLLLGFGGIQAAASSPSSNVEHVLYIALAMGLSLTVTAWLFYRVTGGLFNPNVSLALLLVGVISPVRCVLYCVAQLAGGVAAAALVLALTPGPLSANTFLQAGVNKAQGVFIEAFITSGLVLAVLMLAAEKHQATPFAPIGIGLTLFTGHLFAVYYTGAATNTARSFGPAAVTGFPDSDQWIYWLGPFIGSLLGAGFYTILKHYRYWQINPGQDVTNPEKSPEDPVRRVQSAVSGSRSRNDAAV
ncbi:aquaporin-like protein [Neolentinus lepideus HHB14362 ss-1]|uniref:Aquaporin-like protein n=1 Tax=Neolentinus lepideus HHB14362 ss-1 TaxID=1314782 RepID=A0A165VK83_9AGAM|nr:aquaporin-like protein [Neolentinus lepideus HHB14362 ss-1]